MSARTLLILLTVITLASLPSSVLAQAEPARSGVVVDASGEPIAGAIVSTVAAGGVATPVARTTADGRFALPAGVPAGARLRVERAPFATADLALAQAAGGTGGAGDLRIVLTLATAPEAVTVHAPLVDATTVDSFGNTTTVVTGAQVRDLHALDLASALRRTPGVTISRFTPVGVFGGGDGGAVFVRGAGASRPGSELATSIDGVPFYMGIWNHPLLGLLPVSGVDQIVVHKGPQQAVPDAFAAVNIETRRARTEGIAADALFSGGAFSTVAEQVGLTARHGRWDVAAAQGFARSDGHRPDADGRMFNAHVRAGARLGSAWGAELSALHVDSVGTDPGEVGRPETKTGRYETDGTLLAGTVRHAAGRFTQTVRVYGNRGHGDWYDQPAPDGDTLAGFALVGARWRGHVGAWAGGRITAGLDVDSTTGDVRFNRVAPDPQTTYEAGRLTLTSPFVAVDHGLALGGQWSLTPSAGIRVYEHSVFDGAVAPSAGLVARRGDALRLHATYTRGVNYPGQEVVVLSHLIPPLGESWRSLEPERMHHVEGGVSWAPTRATTIDASVFRDEVSERYVFGFPPAVVPPAFTNLGSFEITGAELAIRHAASDDWHVFGGLTLLDASLETLPYAPARAFAAGVTGRHGPFRVTLDVQAQSGMYVLAASRTAGAANMQRVDGFTVVNARPSWVVPGTDGRAEIFAAIENLFDESYAYRPGYPMPGASAQVGVSVAWRGR